MPRKSVSGMYPTLSVRTGFGVGVAAGVAAAVGLGAVAAGPHAAMSGAAAAAPPRATARWMSCLRFMSVLLLLPPAVIPAEARVVGPCPEASGIIGRGR